MQILVCYYSKTGKTKKLALAIEDGANSVEGITVLCKDVNSVTSDDFVNSSGLIVGSPVYFGSMASDVKKMLDKFVGFRKMMENKIGAAFATSGDMSGGKETTMLSIIQAFLIYGMIVVGDPLSATGHYGVSCVGEPSQKDLENGFKLGKRVAELVKRLFLGKD
ncbi:MAG: flavodoxin [Spirochaetes bacterium GWD1_27_9]|nr:MAG: flavodoxin [Spirochaetes bacterium GWB1_27_13]OHD20358.1 MAG: flavodoxin [Spirochaetes bacterium GWC1_27_15]OHD35580.1 MAG: flavodoxin [Spirochaetes bacterium GWD1_27_9]